MNSIILVCWTCGKKLPVKFEGKIDLGIDFAIITNNAGWVGAIDMVHSRTLAFCSEGCRNAAKKKDGTYRKYPRKLKEVQA
jgi:hypothetical protein